MISLSVKVQAMLIFKHAFLNTVHIVVHAGLCEDWFSTRAVERLCQFSGHDLNNEADAKAEHFTEKFWLRSNAHSQVHHDLLPIMYMSVNTNTLQTTLIVLFKKTEIEDSKGS